MPGRASGVFGALEEHDVGPAQLGEVVQDGGADDATAKALAQLLAVNDSLRVLVLGSCEIGDEGARALASDRADRVEYCIARRRPGASSSEMYMYAGIILNSIKLVLLILSPY